MGGAAAPFHSQKGAGERPGKRRGQGAMMIDTMTEFGARVERRLREEPVIWLTTVRDDLLPQPSPV